MSEHSVTPSRPVETVPVRWDDGVWRVGESNLTLEAVVELYETGLDADEIAREFDGLGLGCVYQVLGYYLRHRDEFHDYLEARRKHLAVRRERGKAAAAEMRTGLQARR